MKCGGPRAIQVSPFSSCLHILQHSCPCVCANLDQGSWLRAGGGAVGSHCKLSLNAPQRAAALQGDHLTLLAVYEGWKNSKFSNPWCYENFVQAGGGCRRGLHAAPAVLARDAWMQPPRRNAAMSRTGPFLSSSKARTTLQPHSACAAIPAFACTRCRRGRCRRTNGVRKQPLVLAILGTSCRPSLPPSPNAGAVAAARPGCAQAAGGHHGPIQAGSGVRWVQL